MLPVAIGSETGVAGRLSNLSPERLKYTQMAFALAGATDIALGLAVILFRSWILPDPETQGVLIVVGALIALMGIGLLIWTFKFLPKDLYSLVEYSAVSMLQVW